MQKKIEIKNKFINHFMGDGKKSTSEKILLKSFKELQKNSKKKTTKILKIALINLTPIFKFHIIKSKQKKIKKKTDKTIPAFISNQNVRTSSAIKFIAANTTKKEEKFKLYKKLNEEILLNAADYESPAIQIKNELQKSVLTKKIFLYYRWR
jgi:ribosomal protein S7